MSQSAALIAAAPETPAPVRHRHPRTRLFFEETGELRVPRAGEWFLREDQARPFPFQRHAGTEWPFEASGDPMTFRRILRPVEIRRDFTAMPEEGYAAGEWEALMDAVGSGQEIEVPEWVHSYFLEVLPPRWMGRGGFVFAEGADFPTWHWSVRQGSGRRYFAQRFFGEAFTPESGAEELAVRLGFDGEVAARFVEIATYTG